MFHGFSHISVKEGSHLRGMYQLHMLRYKQVTPKGAIVEIN